MDITPGKAGLFQKKCGFFVPFVLAGPPPPQATDDVRRRPPRKRTNAAKLTKTVRTDEGIPGDSIFTRPCGDGDVMVTRWQMGIADRDYHRQDRRDGGGFFSQVTPVVKWLLILNLGIYFLDLFLADASGARPMRDFGAFTIQSGVFEGRIWEFITFQFLHGSLEHVLFNCLGIFFFGPWMERWWGSKKFLIYYLLCGAAGGVFYTLLLYSGLLPHDTIYSPLVGASAGIYGILIGVGVVAPDLRVRLLIPPIELSMRQLAIALMSIAAGIVLLGYLGINLFGLVENEGGQAGHLGGAILGFILVKYPWLLGGETPVRIIRSKPFSGNPIPKLRPRSELEKEQDSAVDVILDKISREGFQSLTQAEKDFLQKASNSKQSS